MPYERVHDGLFFIVRWRGVASALETLTLLRDLVETRKRVGQPLIYIAVVPEHAPPPDGAGRKAMSDAMKESLSHCASLHFVMEGTGFKHIAQRSALAGMMLLGGRRGKVFVYESVHDALAAEPLRQITDSARHFLNSEPGSTTRR